MEMSFFSSIITQTQSTLQYKCEQVKKIIGEKGTDSTAGRTYQIMPEFISAF